MTDEVQGTVAIETNTDFDMEKGVYTLTVSRLPVQHSSRLVLCLAMVTMFDLIKKDLQKAAAILKIQFDKGSTDEFVELFVKEVNLTTLGDFEVGSDEHKAISKCLAGRQM